MGSVMYLQQILPGEQLIPAAGIRTLDSTRIFCLCLKVHLVVFIEEVLYLKHQNDRQTENETEMTSMFFLEIAFSSLSRSRPDRLQGEDPGLESPDDKKTNRQRLEPMQCYKQYLITNLNSIDR